MIRIYVITAIVYLSSGLCAYSQSNIDVESLGLDNVNKKEELAFPVIEFGDKKDKEIKKKIAFPKIAVKKDKNDNEKSIQAHKIPTTPVAVPKKEESTIEKAVEKIKDVITGPVIKTKNGTIIKAKKAKPKPVTEEKDVIDEIALTQEQIEVDTKEVKRIEELEKLRQKYLLKAEATSPVEIIILPKRKVVNPFISEEIPAPPILGSYRTSDNNHIPVFLSLDKRIKNLFETITSGDVAYFNSAYQDVKNPNIKNELGDTLLTYSLLTQERAIVASLVSKGADTNMPNRLGFTPLDIAIELRDLQNFELLINNKANIHFTDKFGRTYLFHAARLGFLPAVEALVRRNININVIDKDGFSALDIAYKNKNELVVQYLLKNNAKTWIEKPFDPSKTSLIKKLETRWGKTYKNSQY